MSVDYDGDDATFIINCLKSLRSIINMKYLDIYNNSSQVKVKLNRVIDTYDTANSRAELVKKGLIKEEKSDDVYDDEEAAANVPPISVDINYLEEDEDTAIGASIVKSNKEVSGVFMSEGKIVDIDYFKDRMKSDQVSQDIDNIKHDMLKMMDRIDDTEQSLINLKYLLKDKKVKSSTEVKVPDIHRRGFLNVEGKETE